MTQDEVVAVLEKDILSEHQKSALRPRTPPRDKSQGYQTAPDESGFSYPK